MGRKVIMDSKMISKCINNLLSFSPLFIFLSFIFSPFSFLFVYIWFVIANNRSWLRTRFLINDVLTESKKQQPFRERLSFLTSLSPTLPKHAMIVPTVLCESQSHFDSFYSEVMQKNGEGVVLRHPESVYSSLFLLSYHNSINALIRRMKDSYQKPPRNRR